MPQVDKMLESALATTLIQGVFAIATGGTFFFMQALITNIAIAPTLPMKAR